ncbi:MAG: hypothetical protein ABIZ56_12290 [Chthoniobacteraceae bacterium]
MEWILEKLPVLIFIAVFIAQIVRGIKRSRDVKPAPPPRGDSLDEIRRAQEVQAEIRRKIAERRSGPFREAVPEHRGSQPPPVARPAPPVVVQRDPTAIPDLFGGPIKRMLEELERRAQPAPPPPAAPPVLVNRTAELERQEQLAEELRVLDETRVLVERRARKAADAKVLEARSMPALRTAARGRLMADLHDRESVKRAFVLREVLGTPAGLR